jgi:hypothetical protein
MTNGRRTTTAEIARRKVISEAGTVPAMMWIRKIMPPQQAPEATPLIRPICLLKAGEAE